jgi:succinate-semialdehyde dehydrogenase/glutarate-semialdehyde dehydrogenase
MLLIIQSWLLKFELLGGLLFVTWCKTVFMELKNKALLQTKAFINNRWVAVRAEKTFKVLNPANGAVIANVADCTSTETEMAIKAAYKAFPLWKNKTAKERGALMRKLML